MDGKTSFFIVLWSIVITLLECVVVAPPLNRNSIVTPKKRWHTVQNNTALGKDNRFVRIGSPNELQYVDVPDVSINFKESMQIATGGNAYEQTHHTPAAANLPAGFIEDIDGILGIQRRDFRTRSVQSPKFAPDLRPTAPRKFNRLHHVDPSVVGLGAHVATKGLHVMRGPHWRWGDQDGGPGSVGIIIGDIQNGWCTVQWPSGYNNGYRIGAGDQYDLRIAGEESQGLAPLHTKHPASKASRESSTTGKLQTAYNHNPVGPKPDPQAVGTGTHNAARKGLHVERAPAYNHNPVGPKPDPQAVGMGTNNAARKGLHVERGPHWQWGDQDGGVGVVGTIVGDIKQGWCTVQWPSGYTNGYRIGHAGHYDLRVARRRSHSSPPPKPQKATPSSVPLRQALPGAVLDFPLVRPGLKVQRGPDWRWGDQDGGIGSVGVVQGEESRGWARVKWPSGVENGYRVGDGGKFDLVVVRNHGTSSVYNQKESQHRLVKQKQLPRKIEHQACKAKPRTRCWCIDQYGDVLHLP